MNDNNAHKEELARVLECPLATDEQLCQSVEELANNWHRLAAVINTLGQQGEVSAAEIEITKFVEIMAKNQIALLHELRKMKREHLTLSPLRKFKH